MSSHIYTYQTIESPVESLIKDKGSKFFGFAYPVQDEEDVKQKLESLREIHPKATHHCYAWRLGLDQHHYRANDDGEPSGTAGKPILGQIDSFQLTNCLVVSVRYFGGTKLGVPGLIAAYKASAKETLMSAQVVQKELFAKFELHADYQYLNRVYQWVQQNEGQILEQILTDDCVVRVEVPLRNEQAALGAAASYYPITIQKMKE